MTGLAASSPGPSIGRKSKIAWREIAPLIAFVVLGVAVRLAWLAATDFTFEDAYITFQFAKRLATGQGFVYNIGEPIYGTTTPLLALLLAGWLKIFSSNVVAGARLIGLLASSGSLVTAWAALRRAEIAVESRISALLLLCLSNKLWSFDTGGMETALPFFFIMLSLYAALRGWPGRSGIAAGLLLWTRIDLLAWPFAVALAQGRDRARTLRFLWLCALTYLPWILFATVRFGSPIPHTVTAKWFHYQMGIRHSLALPAGRLFLEMAPLQLLEISTAGKGVVAGITLLFAAYGIRVALRPPALRALGIFAALVSAQIVWTHATFEERYAIPLLSVILVLAGVGFGAVLRALFSASAARVAWAMSAALFSITAGLSAVPAALDARDLQSYRYERSLMAAGRWLHDHTPPGASVLLEPLGYAGYFADRRMIDEVGLVAPAVVALTRQQFWGDSRVFSRILLTKLKPDYILTHCDDARWEFSDVPPLDPVLRQYSRSAVFNPLGFVPFEVPVSRLARTACYEIWARQPPRP